MSIFILNFLLTCKSVKPLVQQQHGDFFLKYNSRPCTIDFHGIFKSVPGRESPILQNISGKAKPGQLVAIMGPSGSGKTTLLNALSGRSKIDQGIITVNGEKLKKDHKRQMAHVLQHDAFLPNLTLDKTLQFHADLGLPSSMTNKQKKDYKKKIASHFQLDDPALLKTKMGDVTKRGLSGGELKRANIACELLSNPDVLFVDEPTTGLDSYNAFKVVENLSAVARNNRTVIMTIHQPSYKMFQKFDMVLLLCKGEVAFFGKREDVLPTLRNLNIEIEAHSNLADILVDQCYIEENRKILIENAKNNRPEDSVIVAIEVPNTTDDNRSSEGLSMDDLNGVSVRRNSQESNELKVKVIIENGSTHHTLINKEGGKKRSGDSGRSSMLSDSSADCVENNRTDKWSASGFQQLIILTKRNFLDSLSKLLSLLGWFHFIVLGLVVAGFWAGTKMTEEYISQIMALIFFSATIWFLSPAFESLSIFSSERVVINKERAAGMYRLLPYYVAKIIAEVPLAMVYPIIFQGITHLGHIEENFTSVLAIAGILLLLVFVSQSLGFFISTTIDNPLNINRGIVACSLVALPSILFGGHFVTKIAWWFSPLKFLSPVYHAYRAMIVIKFYYGSPIECAVENSAYEECLSGATFISPKSLTGVEDPSLTILIAISVLLFYSIIYRVGGYLALRYKNSPTNTL